MQTDLITYPETWRDVVGYEGYYMVSDLGNIKSLRSKKVLRPGDNGRGYMCVSLCVKLARKNRLVHRLVAEAFLQPIQGKNEVNHKDGNKTNNCLFNIEWASKSENGLHKYRILKYQSYACIPCGKYTLDGTLIKEYKSLKDVSIELKINETCVRKKSLTGRLIKDNYLYKRLTLCK